MRDVLFSRRIVALVLVLALIALAAYINRRSRLVISMQPSSAVHGLPVPRCYVRRLYASTTR